MLRTLILPAVEPPYLLVEIVAALYHLTVLPAEFGDDDLEAIARAQLRANRLAACLVLGERRVLAIDAEGVERRETEVPFRLFGHWISAAVTRRLRTARPLPPTDEVLRRQTALEAAIREYPARRAEVLRQRGMLPPADFVVGDLTKGGRDATPAELAALSGRQSNGVPMGLVVCADCGFWKGECLDPNAEFRGKVMRVHCGCDNWNRCAACGETLYPFRLNANYYDQREGAVVHVPGFSGLIHECAGTSRHDG